MTAEQAQARYEMGGCVTDEPTEQAEIAYVQKVIRATAMRWLFRSHLLAAKAKETK